MKKVSPKRFSEFVEVALRAGATAAKIIPSQPTIGTFVQSVLVELGTGSHFIDSCG